ncbi:hypothetical protein ACLMAL_38985 [Nocardia sp. CWNU-33]|uniref:hypothetical protein n=1 Tax=Nocardia sp. CWNU-33 TaxID=3392117 RepID=UPI00398F0DB6
MLLQIVSVPVGLAGRNGYEQVFELDVLGGSGAGQINSTSTLVAYDCWGLLMIAITFDDRNCHGVRRVIRSDTRPCMRHADV